MLEGGLSGARAGETRHATFGIAARSFRPLQPAERGNIRESRLRIFEARPDETPAELADRSGISLAAAR